MVPVIELIDLSIGYNKSPLISNLSYKFRNNIYGIIGESGIGKTTLLRTIAKLNKPISGEVIVQENTDIYVMHQQYTCFDWLNCLDNVLISARVKKSKIDEKLVEMANQSLIKVGLTDYNKYPTELSGGMRQRLALARTLFMQPKIILMDEPLSALDEKTRSEMQELIIENHKVTDNTVILITHSQNEANKMCDQILNLTKKGI